MFGIIWTLERSLISFIINLFLDPPPVIIAFSILCAFNDCTIDAAVKAEIVAQVSKKSKCLNGESLK